MSLKRECDRCHHLTPIDSLNGKDFRSVHIDRGGTASSNGRSVVLTTDYDLCRNCLEALRLWIIRDVAEIPT